MVQTVLDILRWFAPALVIPSSYVAFRYLPGRRVRLWVYFVVLVALMVFDLFRLSLVSDLADLLLRQAVLFMVAEFLWLIALIRSRWALVTAAALIGVLWAVTNRAWLEAGPGEVPHLWRGRPAASYEDAPFTYVVEEHEVPFGEPPYRRFTLTKRRPPFPVEQKIKSYTTPEGYYRTPFHFAWRDTPEGVRVNLVAGPDTLWTLGEGL